MTQLPRYTPATAAEVESIVAEAMAEERGLAVCGGGSKRPMRAPIAAAALLDMSTLTGITAYDHDELVLTARAGTPLAEVEAALAERQQMLAFEPFDHAPLFGAAPGRAAPVERRGARSHLRLHRGLGTRGGAQGRRCRGQERHRF
jgi:hypothetical protein